MGLKIDNVEQLVELLVEHEIITDIDEFRKFLAKLATMEQTPEVRREELAHKERLQERKHAHVERLQNLKHEERLQALEKGYSLPDRGEVRKARSAIRAVGTLSTLVSVTLVTAMAGVSVWILAVTRTTEINVFGGRVDLVISLFAITWAVGGLAVLLTVGASLWAVRQARGASPRQPNLPQRRHVPEDRAANVLG
jgi:hypothetical protein